MPRFAIAENYMIFFILYLVFADDSDLSANIELENANTIGVTTAATTTPTATTIEQIDNAELQCKDSVSNGVLDDNENDNESKTNDGTEIETAAADLNNGSTKNEP